VLIASTIMTEVLEPVPAGLSPAFKDFVAGSFETPCLPRLVASCEASDTGYQ
jgi:hypothetical protein